MWLQALLEGSEGKRKSLALFSMCDTYHFTYREVAVFMPDSLWSDEASDGESCGAVGLVTLHDGVAPGYWHVVNHPLVHVALMDTLTKKL